MTEDGKHSGTIALNRRARFEYALGERFEAGIALEGWEVKALRAGRVAFGESYALIRDGEIHLFGTQITPLPTVSTHRAVDPRRTRKLLLHRREIDRLIGAVEREGYTLVPTAMYWKNGLVKVELALARGKKLHDKRASERERDWQRDRERLLRRGRREA
ncbi:MAG: SsrA-binding protein SmpB [Xanthomonadales bacterium]|nr:SsrA-binding protein SmpB [Xanthomonadales bacterium]